MNWNLMKLSNVAQFIRGVTFEKSVQESVLNDSNLPLLRAGNIQTELDTKNDLIYVPISAVSKEQILQNGDIVICLSSGSSQVVGKSAPLEQDWRGTVGGFCGIVRPKNNINAEYLAYWMRSPSFIEWRDEQARGANIQNLRFSELGILEIAVPCANKQRHIAAKLKAQLAAVEEARQAAQQQIDELTNLANAVIRESLNHPEMEIVSLGDVLNEVKQGIGKGWANYPVLGATRSGLAPAKEPVGKNPERYKPVFHGTVFYNPMRILIGSIAMVDADDEPGITSPDYVAIRGREGLVDSRWFYYWLRSPAGEHCITSLARGAVRERMLFNRLAEGEAAFPPFAVQQKASRILTEIRPMKTHVEAQLREIERLPARLLAEAFGES